MENEKNSRKVFLSVLGVAILIVAVVGISYAAFTFTTGDTGENSIQTGTITMSYSEPAAGLALTNELPMAEATGQAREQYFDFTVVTTVTGKVVIPYEINIIPTFTEAKCEDVANATVVAADEEACHDAAPTNKWIAPLGSEYVKVYLESKVGDGQTYAAANLTNAIAPTVNTLTASSFVTKTGRTGALKLLDVSDDYTVAAGSTTRHYRLRMWVAENAPVQAWITADAYRYAIKVNVDSSVAPLS